MNRVAVSTAVALAMFATAAAAQAPQVETQISQPDLAKATAAELAALAKARVDNPNKPTQWYAAIDDKPAAWFATPEARTMADHILTWQEKTSGGWPLMNTVREANRGDPAQAGPWGESASLIKSTVNEIRFLARVYSVTHDESYRRAVVEGIGYVLKTQYPTGGWPHSWPLRDDYTRYATFNDDEMPDLMTLLEEVATSPRFSFVDAPLRAKCHQAFERGVDFILKSQIRVNGQLTAWGQQHDPVTYGVRPARNFEPAAISGGESAGVLRLLMSIKTPSPQVIAAVKGGIAWYHRSQIDGIDVIYADHDRVVKPDPKAKPVWARYYQVTTNRPIFVGRDAVVKYNLAEIEQERRGGYEWYNSGGTQLFADYDRWKAEHHIS
jgi:PelA/Pel-15E family pectate lyase